MTRPPTRGPTLTARHVVLGAALAFVVVLAVAWTGYRTNLQLIQENALVTRTYRIRETGARVGAALDRLVAARRLARLGPTAALPAEEAGAEAAAAEGQARAGLARLGALVVAPEARAAVARLEPAVLAVLADPAPGPGSPTVRAADAALAELDAVQARLLVRRDERATATARRERVLVIVGGALAAALMVLSGVVLARNLRDLRASLGALEESEGRTRAVLDALPDLLMIVDGEGRIRTFRPPAGVEDPAWVKAMVGNLMPDVLPPAVADTLMRGVRESLASNTPSFAEYTMQMAHVTPDRPGELDFESRFVPVPPGEVLVISRDITERKRVERLKNEFVSTVSHELRTPLTSIRGSLSLIASGMLGELQPRGKKLVEIALNNSERLVRLINDILDIERIESGRLEFRFEPLDLNALVRAAVEDNRGFAQPFGVELEVRAGADEARVNGDRDRLTQVVTNLVSNAVKFAPHGSAVTVTVGREGGAARVAVRDRGPGVPPEFRPRIFGRFAQADAGDTRQSGGTGLGLSISKAIVERHGGRIGFEDHPEGGTVFFFAVPALDDASPAAARPLRVLVCEDDRDVATLLEMMLEQGGLRADVVHRAEDAEALLAREPYDALILDLLLPGKDGATLLRDLRRDPRTATLPVVVVSAVADEQRRVLNGDAISVVDWIDKPIDRARLLSALHLARRHAGDGTLRVLHVEDDPDLGQVVAELLRGTAVTTHAGTLTEARDRLRERHFDLVLLDVALPDGNGLDLVADLRREHPPVPVLVFSAAELNRAGMERVTSALIKARTSNAELLHTIKGLLGVPNDAPAGDRP